MLEFLQIKNLALIENMELGFSSGMNVITGETGAGKSFIIKALNFVLGDKLETSMIRPNADKAEVQALFVHNNEETIIRRELIAETGRSRFFLNNSLTTQDAIRQLRPALLLHASQHGQQKLLQPQYQGKLIDDSLPEKNQPLLLEKDDLLSQLRQVATKKKALLERITELQDKREFLESQKEIISKINPKPNEEDELELIRVEFRSVERIQSLYDKAIALIRSENSFFQGMIQFERVIGQISAINHEFTEDLNNLQQTINIVQEIEQKLRVKPCKSHETGYDIESLESRLFALAQLKRRLKRTLPEILNLQSEIEDNLSFLDNANLDIIQLEKEEEHLLALLLQNLEQLNLARSKSATTFCSSLKQELEGLGFSDQIDIIPHFSTKEIWTSTKNLPSAKENIYSLLFAPNPGQPPQALDKIASGGELSRFLLAITSLQAQSDSALLVFDEVDAGIGGMTLNKVAQRLEKLSSKQQMLLITHWPNLAKYAQKHFYVEKNIVNNQTFTLCSPLNNENIQKELNRMSGKTKKE